MFKSKLTRTIFLLCTTLIIVLSGTTTYVFGANIVWDGEGGDNNWSTGANWSGNVVPGENDDVLFNDTSNKPCEIDISTTVASFSVQAGSTITITAYENLTVTGDFSLSTGTFNAGSTLFTIGGNWSVAGDATFNCETSTVTFNGSGSFNILSSGTTFYSLVFNNSVSTWTLTDALYADGDFTLTDSQDVNSNDKKITIAGDFTINGGKFTAGASTITVSGNWDASNGTFDDGTSLVELIGTGTVANTSSNRFYNVSWAVSGATTTLNTNTWVQNKITFNGGKVTGGAIWLYNTTNSNPLSIDTATTMDSPLYIYASTTTINIPAYTGYPSLYLLSNTTDDTTFNVETGGITTYALYIYGNGFSKESILNLNGQQLNCTSTIFIGNGSGYPGTLTTNNGNIDCGDGSLNIYGLCTLNAGTSTIKVAGNWVASGDFGGSTFNAGTSTVIMDATSGTKYMYTEGTGAFNNLQINASGATIQLEDDLDVDGNFTITAGTFTTKSDENNPIYVAGNWTYEGGVFECNSSTVTFDNASSTSTLTGSTTFYALVSTETAKTIKFSSTTITYVTGHLNFENITLRSTLQGATWYLNLLGSGTQDVSNVNVQDSNASGGSTIYALGASTDSGNNTNWDFGPPAAITDLTGLCDSGTGDVTLSWSTPGDDNWTGTLPDESKYRIDYSTYSIQWSTTTYDVEISTSGVAPHTEVSYTITGLTGDTTWYFQIWTRDEVPTNWSGLSNGATVWVNPILSVTISTDTINLGVVEPGSYTLTVSSVVITNNGNIKQKFKLKIVSEPNATWLSVTAASPGAEQYRYSGIFRSTQPATSDFLPEDSFSVSTERTSSSADLARDADPDDQKGFNVPADSTRNLWFKFEAPTSTDITTTQAIPLTITAEPYP